MEGYKTKRLKLLFGVLLLIILLLSTAYIFIYSANGGYNYLDNGLFRDREINTPLKLWLNGYLGIFLRFDKFGIINWLMFPLLAYFAFNIQKRKLKIMFMPS